MSDIEGWVDEVHTGHVVDKLAEMPSDSVHCVVTSPPYYGLRSYSDSDDEIGKEVSLDEYIGKMVAVGNELQRVLRDDGSWWLNLGDTYSGGGGAAGVPEDWDSISTGNMDKYPDEPPAKNTSFPDKDKMLVPHRTAIALQESGWMVRNDVVWDKQGSSMPESVKDRLSTTFEYVFHFVQQGDYYYDLDSIREPYSKSSKVRAEYSFEQSGNYVGDGYDSGGFEDGGAVGASGKNPGDIFRETTASFPEAHFAVFPGELIEKPIKATCPEDGIVLDPFIGAGTTAVVAQDLGRKWIGIDLNDEYVDMAESRARKNPGSRQHNDAMDW